MFCRLFKVGFYVKDGCLVLIRKEKSIEASFGLCHPKTSVSLEDLEH